MYNTNLRYEYYTWLVSLVDTDEGVLLNKYDRIMNYLFTTPFIFSLNHDENRASDGISMRLHFGEDNCEEKSDIFVSMPYECTCLEMMVALANRIENDIMYDPTLGNRTWQWFWEMIRCLGLDRYDDEHFDAEKVRKIVDIFMHRQYERDGSGGLFKTFDTSVDMRKIEIWYQMQHFVNDYFAIY